MERWKCKECGEIYDEFTADKVDNGDGTLWVVCPKCGADEREPTYICEWCDEEHQFSKIVKEYGICKKCLVEHFKIDYFLYFIEAHQLEAEAYCALFDITHDDEFEDMIDSDYKIRDMLMNCIARYMKEHKNLDEMAKWFCTEEPFYQYEYADCYINDIRSDIARARFEEITGR